MTIQTTTARTTSWKLTPIDAATASARRATGGIRYVADSKPGFPCRQCLRDAEVGEELILVSHDPFAMASPYRSASPIFLHANPCAPDPRTGGLPEQLTCRQLSVRAFDHDALMIDAAIIDGVELGPTLDRFFGEPATHHVHVHNASRGCWAVSVERVS